MTHGPLKNTHTTFRNMLRPELENDHWPQKTITTKNELKLAENVDLLKKTFLHGMSPPESPYQIITVIAFTLPETLKKKLKYPKWTTSYP